jgi:hypothetical protein
MDNNPNLCLFCCRTENKSLVNGLEMCARCVARFSGLCLTYKNRVLSQVSPIGWEVDLVSHAPQDAEFPKANKPLFYIRCRKGTVTLTTAVDKVAFYAAASRLHFDVKLRNRPASNRRRAVKKGKRSS